MTRVRDAVIAPLTTDNLEQCTVIDYGDRCLRMYRRSRSRRRLGQRIVTGYGAAPFIMGEP
jgi:hypothetical protein